jgi:N-ethylmaleimide reductase
MIDVNQRSANVNGMTNLFEPISLGATKLANRIAMAPMTRNRAGQGEIATPLMAEYYRQRASAGLIVTEATQPSRLGQGYPATPGLHTDEHVESWTRVTEAVHAEGSVIYVQLMHAGRVAHPDLFGGEPQLGPSPVVAPGQSMTPAGMKDNVVPRELTDAGIHEVIAEFADSARKAVDAGFDGVELHGANGYLIQQFLSVTANTRTDKWGGSAANRARFAAEVTHTVAKAIGPERTALRISPTASYQGIDEGDSAELYRELLAQISGLPLAFLHVVEAPGQRELTKQLRADWAGNLMLNPHRDVEPLPPHAAAQDAIEAGADIVSFGSSFLSNPDLPARLAAEGPYNAADHTTFYGGDHTGYVDYPTLKDA